MTRTRSEIAASAWQARYIAGVCELAEMEAGVARALAGECSDDEWLWLIRHSDEVAAAKGSDVLDARLKSAFIGPIRGL